VNREIYEWISKKCEWCGESYCRPAGYHSITDKQWEDRRFCSMRCANTYRSGLVKVRAGNKLPFPFPQKGHLNYNAKLTEDDVRAIRTDERKHRLIADDFNISIAYVSKLKRRIKWPHLE